MSTRSRLGSRFSSSRSLLAGVALLIVLSIAGSFAVDSFLSPANLRSMLLLAAFLGLASLGQTMCALLGGLDLSIPFVIGATNILLPALLSLSWPAPLAILFLSALGAVVGALNGLLTFRVQGQALIMTLGMGLAVVGAAQIAASNGAIEGGNNFGAVPAWLSNFASIAGNTYGLPVPGVVVIWILASIVVVAIMTNTWFGRSFYALGGSRVAAARLGISERYLWTAAYTISGAVSAFTGVALLGFSGGGFVGVGDPYLFTTVAAVVIGGTSLLGGWGGYGATVVGVLVLTVLTTLLVGLGLSYAAQQAVFGLLIVPMVAIYARSPHIRMQI
jgi:ribose transport system permease protein